MLRLFDWDEIAGQGNSVVFLDKKSWLDSHIKRSEMLVRKFELNSPPQKKIKE